MKQLEQALKDYDLLKGDPDIIVHQQSKGKELVANQLQFLGGCMATIGGFPLLLFLSLGYDARRDLAKLRREYGLSPQSL